MATNESVGATAGPVVRPDSTVSRRIADAVEFAVRAHGNQVRKGTSIPYVSHLFGVAALVLEGGGDEDLAIAGLLHDALEDTAATAAQVDKAFGLASLPLSWDAVTPKRSQSRLLLSASSSILSTWRRQTPTLCWFPWPTSFTTLARFCSISVPRVRPSLSASSSAREETLWYYGELSDTFCRRRPGALADELKRVVADPCTTPGLSEGQTRGEFGA